MAPLLPLPCGGRENKRGALNPSVGHRRPDVHGLDLRVAQQLADAFLEADVAVLGYPHELWIRLDRPRLDAISHLTQGRIVGLDREVRKPFAQRDLDVR
jgi:hypothetical protein